MHPQLPPLIELQVIDLRILEIKEQHRKIPALIEAAEAPLREARNQLKTATAALEALTKERRERERELEIHEAQVEKLRGRLMELKTNKEYQAHLFEIEMANKKKGEIEEQILTVLERIDTCQEEVRQAKNRVAEAERVFLQEKSRQEALTADLQKELDQLERKQKEVASGVEPAILNQYNKVKAMRKDLAVTPVRNGICFGCRLQLPPQLVAEVKRTDALLTCPYCHRILYWEGEPVSVPVSDARDTEE